MYIFVFLFGLVVGYALHSTIANTATSVAIWILKNADQETKDKHLSKFKEKLKAAMEKEDLH